MWAVRRYQFRDWSTPLSDEDLAALADLIEQSREVLASLANPYSAHMVIVRHVVYDINTTTAACSSSHAHRGPDTVLTSDRDLRMIAAIIRITIGACLLPSAMAFASPEIPRASLDELWESHMLAGTGASYYDGVRSENPRTGSFAIANGSPDSVWPTHQGIRVQDFRETALGGLLRKGGWRIEGGPLDRFALGAFSVDLYGKSVWRVKPSLIQFGQSPPRSAQHSYEFFLLKRIEVAADAVVIKSWVLPADKIPYNYYLSGSLRYDRETQTIAVKAVGRDDGRVFIEDRVDVSRILEK